MNQYKVKDRSGHKHAVKADYIKTSYQGDVSFFILAPYVVSGIAGTDELIAFFHQPVSVILSGANKAKELKNDSN